MARTGRAVCDAMMAGYGQCNCHVCVGMTNNDLTLTMLTNAARAPRREPTPPISGRPPPRCPGDPIRAACIAAADLALERVLAAARRRLTETVLSPQEVGVVMSRAENDARDWLAGWIGDMREVA